ncbi:MAG TPA: tetratricopeptide repeat protein [Rhizomicrobium sp.]|nr:tetratricopeptide repeat protein [Rhizomicrobium sp.]
MKLRTVSANRLNLSGLAILGLLFISPANASVTVLGGGAASDCYKAAEFDGDPIKGVTTCTSALENISLSIQDRAATLINRGILKGRIDDLHGALADYNAGIKLNDQLGEGYVDRGAVLISLHRYQAALADITKGIALGASKPAVAYYDRAIVNEALGNTRAAYEDFQKALEIDPNMGLASMQLERFKVVRKGGRGGA